MRYAERLFVWAGGAVFVASLAYCTYSYVVSWEHPVNAFITLPADSTVRDLGPALLWWFAILGNCFTFSLFALHHSLFARDTVKRLLARFVPERLLRSVYVWTSSLLLIIVCRVWEPVGGDVYRVSGALAYLFAAVQIAGLGLIAASVRAIDPLELAGIRSNPDTGPLQTTGPYGWVRHPLYLGWMMAVFGAAHMTSDRLEFAVVSSLYLVIAVPWEERSLARALPGPYTRYMQQVRWRIVPYVY